MRLILTIALLLPLCLPAFAHPGIGIVVDQVGNVYYTDLKQVWRLDARGNKTVAVPNVHTHELYLDAAGNLFGEHLWYTGPQDGSGTWHFRVWKRTPDGRVADVIPATAGFRQNVSFVRDPAGNMYAAGESDAESTRTIVRRIDPQGRSTRLAGGGPAFADGNGPAAGFRDIRWMAFGADQKLYVIDGPALRRVTSAGTVTTLARDLTEATLNPLKWDSRHVLMGLTADAQGNVYLANYGASKVKKVGRDGQVTAFERSSGKWSPTGVALAPNGDKVYILEYGGLYDVRVRSVALTPSKR